MVGSYQNLSNFKIGKKKVSTILYRGLGIVLVMVRDIALGWAIIMAAAIGIKYMTGSPQIKSQLKTDMPTYAVGALLLFGAAGLMHLLQVFTEDVVVVK